MLMTPRPHKTLLTPEKAQGCLLGLALGDAYNAPLEGGPLERIIWLFIGTTLKGERRYTDDTQMSLDMAHSLIELGEVDLDDMARRFAEHRKWSRGYGLGASKLLKEIKRGKDWRAVNRSIFPSGSFGNGAAMRAPVLGLVFGQDPDTLMQTARDTASITHSHELGMQGAMLIAQATSSALYTNNPLEIMAHVQHVITDPELLSKLAVADTWLREETIRTAPEVRRELGNGMTALTSCVTALYIACAHMTHDFEQVMAFVGRCKGDTDTIGAMAGAIWGAVHGVQALPTSWIERLEDADLIKQAATNLVKRFHATPQA